jgi:hypothetical protein
MFRRFAGYHFHRKVTDVLVSGRAGLNTLVSPRYASFAHEVHCKVHIGRRNFTDLRIEPFRSMLFLAGYTH